MWQGKDNYGNYSIEYCGDRKQVDERTLQCCVCHTGLERIRVSALRSVTIQLTSHRISPRKYFFGYGESLTRRVSTATILSMVLLAGMRATVAFSYGNFTAIRNAFSGRPYPRETTTNSMEDLFVARCDCKMHSRGCRLPFVFIASTFEQPRNGKRSTIASRMRLHREFEVDTWQWCRYAGAGISTRSYKKL